LCSLNNQSLFKDRLYDIFETTTKIFQDTIGAPHSKQFNSVFFGGILGSLFSALQFLSSPLFGALSDVYGRKPLLLLIFLFQIWSQASKFSLFVLSRIIGGLSRANISIITALIGIAFSIGFIVGPMFGAYLSHSSRLFTTDDPLYNIAANFALPLTLIELFIVLLFMSETLNPSKRVITFDLFCNNFYSLKKVLIMRAYGRAYFIYLFIYSGLEFTLENIKFCRMQQGKMYVFTGVLMMLLQGGLVRRIPVEKLHQVVVFAIALIIPSFITIAFAETQIVFYGGLTLYAIASAIVVPCLTSCVSNLASAHSKGATIGVFRCLGALARALGPLVASTCD
uniref:Major facilitator superfamily (MFS) profile domain-containing protein n=1 Tax=Parascaris equorum TaxID=6256 RepID=A0A914RD64_PAREQ